MEVLLVLIALLRDFLDNLIQLLVVGKLRLLLRDLRLSLVNSVLKIVVGIPELVHKLLDLLLLRNETFALMELFLHLLLMLTQGLLDFVLHGFSMILKLYDLIIHLLNLVEVLSEI